MAFACQAITKWFEAGTVQLINYAIKNNGHHEVLVLILFKFKCG